MKRLLWKNVLIDTAHSWYELNEKKEKTNFWHWEQDSISK